MKTAGTNRDDRETLNFLDRVCQCNGLDQLLDSLLADLRQFLGADTACGFELAHDGDTLWVGKSATVNMDQRVIATYNDEFLRMDPICSTLYSPSGVCQLDSNRAQITLLSDRVDLQKSDHSYYCNEFLMKEHLDHVLGISFRPTIKDHPLLVLGFQRNRDQRDFDQDDLRKARSVLPALLSRFDYFSMGLAFKNLELQLASADGVRSYEIIIWNEDKISIYQVDRGNKTCLYGPKNSKIFYPGIGAILKKLAGKPLEIKNITQVLYGLGINGIPREYLVHVRTELDSPRCQVFRIDAAPPRRRDFVEAWAEVHSLTEREAEIVEKLFDGLKNQEIAHSLDLSVRTVENHLRSIFSKAGITSRTQALSSLSNFAVRGLRALVAPS
ncbi:helix-turn-helix domain-containing protein [Rhizorhabdus argentea]|uniref:helix-turn-helix domain-containing protein n=1 Tax=Rhizorhabdus argentea TaxID=1387174 RepID=UPI0030EDB5C2